MKYYPINLDIDDRNCLVVGGGAVASRKVLGLLECGARITVVSPSMDRRLLALKENSALVFKQRGYAGPTDMEGMFLVIGATDDRDLNQRIYRDAEALGKLCNIADEPETCNFILPAVVQRGDLVIAVSTSGKSPAFAKQLRKQLEQQFGEEYATFLHLMGAIRKKLLDSNHDPAAHKKKFERLIAQGLVQLIRDKNTVAIDALLKEILGNDYDFNSLTNP